MQSEGGWARIAWAGGKLSTMETVCHVGRVKKQFKGGPGGAASEPGLNDFVAMAVGADGLGAGVLDRLLELGHSVTEIRGGQPAVEPEDLVNRRSEWYWNLRPRFENCEIDIDPDDDVPAKQHVAIKWKRTSKGQIAVETKEERRKRGLPVT